MSSSQTRDHEAEGGLLVRASGRTARRRVLRVTLSGDGRAGGSIPRADFLAGAEPLGIRTDGAALTLTMRTPGGDLELAAGFLVSEAVVRSPADITEIKLCDGTACGHADHDGMGYARVISANVCHAASRSRLTLSPGRPGHAKLTTGPLPGPLPRQRGGCSTLRP
jgi:hypothetical protein